MYVIRGKSGFKLFSTESETFGQEVKCETKEQAELTLEQMKDRLPFEEFEIMQV